MTRADHQSGTERLAEVVEKCAFSDDTIIVNIQGDEPMIPPAIVRQVAENLAASTAVWRRWRCRSTMRKRRLIRMR
jgi:3-deoxy-manno-octulosonate cytidylyltransferase (CMP-KDO synthetase)